jgi:TolB-like protein/cytochrome c-type biogenesis protein CcmH/NrfG
MAPSAPLRLKLLGGFEARSAEGPVIGISAKKTRALLAYLALTSGRAHGRGKLAELLWSDRRDKQARDSLRQALAELRGALADIRPVALSTDHDLVSLDPAAVEVDALRFAELAGRDNAEELRRAVVLYEGDLLDDLDVRDPAFDDWLRDERRHYRELVVVVLKKLLAHETGGSAIAIAQRVLMLDPLQEEGYRALMRLHAEAGDIAAALRQYDTCRATLKRELDVPPSPETEALHRQIRDPSVARPGSDRAAVFTTDTPRPPTASTSKPSVAVLPFRNLSGDPEQQYFSDGITEDIITGLSRFRQLFVIARNSSFQYRGKEVDVSRLGHELGVQYVVEGSIRKAAERVRITAQLIDAATGNHLWAERFDRDYHDVFAVQDEVTQMIVSTLVVRLEDEGLASAKRKPPASMKAYDYWLRGKMCLDLWTKPAHAEARAFFEKAIAIDPGYARAYAGLALTYEWAAYYSAWGGGDPTLPERAEALALKAAELDPTDHVPLVTLGWINTERRDYERARRYLDRAEALNPNDADMLINKAVMLSLQGEPDAALALARSAIRLNPLHPDYYLGYLAHCYFIAGRYEEAMALREGLSNVFPEGRIALAVLCVLLGRLEEARGHIEKFVADFPSHWIGRPSVSFVTHHIFHYKRKADAEVFLNALRQTGLPE